MDVEIVGTVLARVRAIRVLTNHAQLAMTAARVYDSPSDSVADFEEGVRRSDFFDYSDSCERFPMSN